MDLSSVLLSAFLLLVRMEQAHLTATLCYLGGNRFFHVPGISFLHQRCIFLLPYSLPDICLYILPVHVPVWNNSDRHRMLMICRSFPPATGEYPYRGSTSVRSSGLSHLNSPSFLWQSYVPDETIRHFQSPWSRSHHLSFLHPGFLSPSDRLVYILEHDRQPLLFYILLPLRIFFCIHPNPVKLVFQEADDTLSLKLL